MQQRVLALIFGHPGRSFYTSEIVRKIQLRYRWVENANCRACSRADSCPVEWIGNQKHYRANRNSPIFTELQSIILKTAGLAEPLRQSLVPYADRIKVAFVYGSVAKGSDTAQSDIDLMVVGEDLSYADLFTALQKADETLQRNVNPSFLSVDEWRRKIIRLIPSLRK